MDDFPKGGLIGFFGLGESWELGERVGGIIGEAGYQLVVYSDGPEAHRGACTGFEKAVKAKGWGLHLARTSQANPETFISQSRDAVIVSLNSTDLKFYFSVVAILALAASSKRSIGVLATGSLMGHIPELLFGYRHQDTENGFVVIIDQFDSTLKYEEQRIRGVEKAVLGVINALTNKRKK